MAEWPGTPGDGPLTVPDQVKVASANNLMLGEALTGAASGQVVFAMANAIIAPSSLGGIGGGGFMWCTSGNLTFMGPNGIPVVVASGFL